MYDLRVVVEEVKGFCDLPMKPGDYFEVKGGRILVPEGKYICLWALQSMMPLLPLKQRRIAEENDWVPHTKKICCPDPNGMVIYRIDALDSETSQPVQEGATVNDQPKPRILLDQDKCTGCRACEVVCAYQHTGSFCGENAFIRVKKNEEEGQDIPYVCRQCGNALCVAACPTKALFRDPQTKAILIKAEDCVGCKACAKVCPFGSITFNQETGTARICDLCQGDPACVKRCPSEALVFGNAGNRQTKRGGEKN